MVYFSRRATVKLGEFPKAIEWAKEVAEFINSKYGTNFSIYTQMLGDNPVNTLYWITKLESMEKYMELSNALVQDQEYITKIADARNYFIDGTTYDSILMKQQ